MRGMQRGKAAMLLMIVEGKWGDGISKAQRQLARRKIQEGFQGCGRYSLTNRREEGGGEWIKAKMYSGETNKSTWLALAMLDG